MGPVPDVHLAVMLVTALPLSNDGPSKSGAVNTTWAAPFAAFAVTLTGASGTSACTTAFEAADGWLVPAPLVAVTVQVYVRPLVRPLTVIGLDPPDPLPAAPPLLDEHDAVKLLTG